MSQYVYGMGEAQKIPSDVDVVAAINSMFTQLTNAYQELRTIIGNYTVAAGSKKEQQAKAIAVELNDWRKRIINFFKQRGASVPNVVDYASLILIPFPFSIATWWKANVTSTSQRTAIYWDMKRFQVEMQNFGDRVTTLTGIKPVWTTPSKDPAKEPGKLDSVTDFLWGTVKIGAVGLLVWYGGKLAYSYLDQKTRYPKEQLPKYAGGRRRS